MKIVKNKYVAVEYELRLDAFDGELVEETRENEPEEFIFGQDQMLDVFENQLKGKEKGDTFKIEIPPENAFGEYDPDAQLEFTETEFMDLVGDEMEDLEIGAFIPMEDDEGNQYDGIITEYNDDRIVIDFNHPLAGETLYFRGKVVDVRDAGEEKN
ncbi:MAG: FKBP-type peptidyl-prolyl cis-trans isomerase [Bacteroidota bacterium]|nr:FKBP-type peptidyl-prolyl cis-trans isomerase [Bacteroidota bacterium]